MNNDKYNKFPKAQLQFPKGEYRKRLYFLKSRQINFSQALNARN
jgi:hypothetical protein